MSRFDFRDWNSDTSTAGPMLRRLDLKKFSQMSGDSAAIQLEMLCDLHLAGAVFPEADDGGQNFGIDDIRSGHGGP